MSKNWSASGLIPLVLTVIQWVGKKSNNCVVVVVVGFVVCTRAITGNVGFHIVCNNNVTTRYLLVLACSDSVDTGRASPGEFVEVL